MAPKSVTFRRHDHLVSVLFGDLLSHSYNITFSMFLYLVYYSVGLKCSLVALLILHNYNRIIIVMVSMDYKLLACYH